MHNRRPSSVSVNSVNVEVILYISLNRFNFIGIFYIFNSAKQKFTTFGGITRLIKNYFKHIANYLFKFPIKCWKS